MPSFREKVHIGNVRAVRDSGKALLVEIDGEEVWIPHSQIDDDSEVYEEGTEGTLVVSDWIADEKGLG